MLCLQDAKAEQLKTSNCMRFINAMLSGELVPSRRDTADVEANLGRSGYERIHEQEGSKTVLSSFLPSPELNIQQTMVSIPHQLYESDLGKLSRND